MYGLVLAGIFRGGLRYLPPLCLRFFRALWGRYLPVLGATVGGSRSTRLRAVTLGKGRVPLRFVLDHAIVGSYQ